MNHIVSHLVLAALFSNCFATRFSDCGSITGRVDSVDITGCPDEQEVCKLKKGSHVDAKINFTPEVDSKSLTASANAIILVDPIPLTVPEPNACKSGVKCPVRKGKSYSYKNTIEIKDYYPDVALTVRLQLKDDQSKDMVCIEVDCKIESG